jgi:hypothetical protein
MRKEVVERKVEISGFEHRAGPVWSCEVPGIVEELNELGSSEIWLCFCFGSECEFEVMQDSSVRLDFGLVGIRVVNRGWWWR